MCRFWQYFPSLLRSNSRKPLFIFDSGLHKFSLSTLNNVEKCTRYKNITLNLGKLSISRPQGIVNQISCLMNYKSYKKIRLKHNSLYKLYLMHSGQKLGFRVAIQAGNVSDTEEFPELSAIKRHGHLKGNKWISECFSTRWKGPNKI